MLPRRYCGYKRITYFFFFFFFCYCCYCYCYYCYCYCRCGCCHRSILGLTLDYGAFGFVEAYDEDFVSNGSGGWV